MLITYHLHISIPASSQQFYDHFCCYLPPFYWHSSLVRQCICLLKCITHITNNIIIEIKKTSRNLLRGKARNLPKVAIVSTWADHAYYHGNEIQETTWPTVKTNPESLLLLVEPS